MSSPNKNVVIKLILGIPKEVSEKLNIHPMTIKGRLKSPKFDNYKYKN